MTVKISPRLYLDCGSPLLPKKARLGLALAVSLASAALVLRWQSRLPSLANRNESRPRTGIGDTHLARTYTHLVAARPGLSGVRALSDGREAFEARMALAEAAEFSLDVQYYIWAMDLSGTLLLDALRRAADRGVRVRLLLDDGGTSGLDSVLAAIDSHPMIEVRLFNPFVLRRIKTLGFLTDFKRLNRRMHNKSFTADGQVTVIGGRNIGDRYFKVQPSDLFIDLDVAAVGPAVEATCKSFQAYWHSDSSYPASRILPGIPVTALPELQAEASRVTSDPAAGAYMEALHAGTFGPDLLSGRLTFDWGVVHFLSDDPAKALARAPHGSLIVDRLEEVLGEPQRELGLVSGYFVPTEALIALLSRMVSRGVRISIVTNALDATDVRLVAAAYGKFRKRLLSLGIKLFEIRGVVMNKEPEASEGYGGYGGSSGSGSSGASMLHAKTFTVDRERVFIGSFNLDPRSARLNTEQGFIIHSSALAGRLSDGLAKLIPQVAYEVRRTERGRLFWLELSNGRMLRHEVEPGSHRLERIWLWFSSHMPFDWML